MFFCFVKYNFLVSAIGHYEKKDFSENAKMKTFKKCLFFKYQSICILLDVYLNICIKNFFINMDGS